MSGRYKHNLYPKLKTRRGLQKRDPSVLYRSMIDDGVEEVTYEVNIDLHELDAMAKKAAGNATKLSHAGPIQVRVLLRERVTP